MRNKKLKSWLRAIGIMVLILLVIAIFFFTMEWIAFNGYLKEASIFIAVIIVILVTWLIQMDISKKEK